MSKKNTVERALVNMITEGIPDDVRASATPEQLKELEHQSRIYDALDEAAHGATQAAMLDTVATYIVDKALGSCDTFAEGMMRARDMCAEINNAAKEYCRFMQTKLLAKMTPEEALRELQATIGVLESDDSPGAKTLAQLAKAVHGAAQAGAL